MVFSVHFTSASMVKLSTVSLLLILNSVVGIASSEIPTGGTYGINNVIFGKNKGNTNTGNKFDGGKPQIRGKTGDVVFGNSGKLIQNVRKVEPRKTNQKPAVLPTYGKNAPIDQPPVKKNPNTILKKGDVIHPFNKEVSIQQPLIKTNTGKEKIVMNKFDKSIPREMPSSNDSPVMVSTEKLKPISKTTSKVAKNPKPDRFPSGKAIKPIKNKRKPKPTVVVDNGGKPQPSYIQKNIKFPAPYSGYFPTSDQFSYAAGYRQKYTKVGNVPPEPTDTGCPYGWMSYSGRCYYFSRDKISWFEASMKCRFMGGFLAIADAPHENSYFKLVAKKIGFDDSCWIGLNDILFDKIFIWEGGNKQCKWWDWFKNEPNNSGSGYRHCVSLSNTCGFQWKVDNCNRKSYYICEFIPGKPCTCQY